MARAESASFHFPVEGGQSIFWGGVLSVGAYLIKDTDKAILFDSGYPDTAKKVNRGLKDLGYRPVAIINTHSHPDHVGGNSYFQQQVKLNAKGKVIKGSEGWPPLPIYTARFERHFMENKEALCNCFCSGASAFEKLKTKFLEPEECVVQDQHVLNYRDHEITVEGVAFKIVTLPGHTPGSIGIITPDRVLYCGDALIGGPAYNDLGVLLYTNITNTLATFDKLERMYRNNEFVTCVMYHGGCEGDIMDTVSKHRKRILETQEELLGLCVEPLSVDELTAKMMQKYQDKYFDTQYGFALTKATVNAFISNLELEKRVEFTMREGLQLIVALDAPRQIEPSAASAAEGEEQNVAKGQSPVVSMSSVPS